MQPFTLRKPPQLLQVEEQLAALAVVRDHVQLVSSLERETEGQGKRVKDGHHYHALGHGVLHLVPLNHL